MTRRAFFAMLPLAALLPKVAGADARLSRVARSWKTDLWVDDAEWTVFYPPTFNNVNIDPKWLQVRGGSAEDFWLRAKELEEKHETVDSHVSTSNGLATRA